jgi:flagellar biosynthesis/type III secretory pathway protein FliH
MRDEKILLDYYSGINYAKRTGFEEGLGKGLEQGREEVISLLQSGKSLDEIIREYTGSTKTG